MLKVVIDTNVFISAIGWGGTPLKVLELWKQDRISLYVSLPIISEIEGVIIELNLPLELWQEWKKLIFDRAYFVEGEAKTGVHLRDMKDAKFIECALLGGVSYIISGDKDLLDLRQYEGIKIVSPHSFLNPCKS